MAIKCGLDHGQLTNGHNGDDIDLAQLSRLGAPHALRQVSGVQETTERADAVTALDPAL